MQKYNSPRAHAAAVQAMRNRLRFGVADPRAEWEQAKAAQRAPGRPESEVIALAMRKHPELITALTAYQPPAQAARPDVERQAYEAKVAAGVARGLKRSDAICAAMRDR
jgi:hypothetical protein